MISNFRFKLIIILYLTTRLVNLTSFPIFADEAIYIKWGQLSVHLPDQYKFLSVLDGKPPLHNWTIGMTNLIISDPLFSARIISVLFGLLSLVLLDLILKEFKLGGKERLLGSLIIIFSPYWMFYTRMGLAESMLASLYFLAIYSGLSILQSPNYKNNLIFTLAIGASLWTKTSSVFYLFSLSLLPALELVRIKNKLTLSDIKSAYFSSKSIRMALLAFLGLGIFALLSISPTFPSLFARSIDYSFKIDEILLNRKYILTNNLPNSLIWIIYYFPLPLIVLTFFNKRVNLIFALMAFICIVPIVITSKSINPRYIFPAIVPLTIMVCLGAKQLLSLSCNKVAKSVFLYSFLPVSLYFNYPFIFNNSQTPFVLVDKNQYLYEWSSGYGIENAVNFLKNRVIISDRKITVATEGYFGTLPDGIWIYFREFSSDKIDVYGIGQPVHEIPNELRNKAKLEEVYLVVNENRLKINSLPDYIKLIEKYPRPDGRSALLLFKINYE